MTAKENKDLIAKSESAVMAYSVGCGIQYVANVILKCYKKPAQVIRRYTQGIQAVAYFIVPFTRAENDNTLIINAIHFENLIKTKKISLRSHILLHWGMVWRVMHLLRPGLTKPGLLMVRVKRCLLKIPAQRLLPWIGMAQLPTNGPNRHFFRLNVCKPVRKIYFCVPFFRKGVQITL